LLIAAPRIQRLGDQEKFSTPLIAIKTMGIYAKENAEETDVVDMFILLLDFNKSNTVVNCHQRVKLFAQFKMNSQISFGFTDLIQSSEYQKRVNGENDCRSNDLMV
jgi:hypothetical protein